MRVLRDLEGNESSEINEEEEQEILNYLKKHPWDHFGSWQTRSNQDSGSFFVFFLQYVQYIQHVQYIHYVH